MEKYGSQSLLMLERVTWVFSLVTDKHRFMQAQHLASMFIKILYPTTRGILFLRPKQGRGMY